MAAKTPATYVLAMEVHMPGESSWFNLIEQLGKYPKVKEESPKASHRDWLMLHGLGHFAEDGRAPVPLLSVEITFLSLEHQVFCN